MNLTAELLARICRHAHSGLDAIAADLTVALRDADAQSPERTAMFLAQLLHESDEFRYVAEVWGPTPAQTHYEPPHPLAAKLGNTQPGDGFRFRGRGYIQLTGRANYRACGAALGLELEAHPEIAEHIPGRVSAWFWLTHGLNRAADIKDCELATKLVNGGLNGLALRQDYYERACAALGMR